MNTEDNTPLERDLAMLTTWSGESPELWRGAVAAEAVTKAHNAAKNLRSPLHLIRSRKFVMYAAAVIGLFALVPALNYIGRSAAERNVAVSSPPLESMRWSRAASQKPADEQSLKAKVYSDDNSEGFAQHNYSTAAGEGKGATRKLDALGYSDGGRFGAGQPATPAYERFATSQKPGDVQLPAARHVIRKATIELRTRDVRAAFAKTAQLISEAGGEFVQDSSLTGNDDRLQANLTLRVAAERLSTILQALRELGEVKSEAAGGEDVTSQVVDLEARLTNERRVEQELLQLLESRKDAPLKEILELRTAIDGVRQSIETMTAQRERLGRLVSLATVLVLIRTPEAPDKPVDEGLAAYFGNALQHAALRGVRALIDTLAGLTLVLIGGGIWILLALLAFLYAWRAFRRQSVD